MKRDLVKELCAMGSAMVGTKTSSIQWPITWPIR